MAGARNPSPRLCPRDRHPLKVDSFHGVEVDRCLECDSVWLDRGEMAQIAPGFDRGELRQPARALPRAYAVFRCPACRGDLLPRYYGSRRERVELDACINCGGLWLHVRDMRLMSTRIERSAPESTVAAGGEVALTEDVQAIDDKAIVSFPRQAREWFVALTGMPLDIANPVATVPYATWSLIALNVAVFLYQVLLVGDQDAFIRDYSLIPARAHEGDVFRYVTAMFLHANLFHLAGNLFFLYTFGDNIEDRYGALPYLLLYFSCGLVGGVFSSFLPISDSLDVPRLGASGAVSGVLGAYLVAYPRTRLLVGGLFFRFIPLVFHLPVWIFLLLWVVLNVVGWLVQQEILLHQDLQVSVVDYVAHLGGFLTGLLAGGLFAVWWSARSASAEA